MGFGCSPPACIKFAEVITHSIHEGLVKKLSRRTINMHCKLVACGVVAGEVSGAADGCSRGSSEKGRSKVPTGCFTSTGQMNISGVINMHCRINHVQGVIVSDNHLIDFRPWIGIKVQNLTRFRWGTADSGRINLLLIPTFDLQGVWMHCVDVVDRIGLD